MYIEGFPSKLKKAREKWGFSQREVSKETGILQSSLAKYETGKVEPSIETLGILADFYNVSTDWLIGTGYINKNEENIESKKNNMKFFVSASNNIINENGNMYIELTAEQMKKIKEAT